MSKLERWGSDFSKEEIVSHEQRGRVIVLEHSGIEAPVALDATLEEVAKVAEAGLKDVVRLRLMRGDDPEGEPQEVIMDEKVFAKLLGRNAAQVTELLEEAEPFAVKAAKPTVRESINYGTEEHAGEPHRGKTTDEEKKLVHDDLEGVNARLRAKGLREVDLDNPEHVARYGLEDLAKERGVTQEPSATTRGLGPEE